MKTGLMLSLALVAALTTGCGEDLLDNGPQIVSMTITPDEIPSTSTGMTDQFVTVTLTVSGFTDAINVDATRVFIEDNDVEGVFQTATLSGDTITLDEIATSWFQGLTPGAYPLGAEVFSVDGENGEPTESVSQLGLATVTITE